MTRLDIKTTQRRGENQRNEIKGCENDAITWTKYKNDALFMAIKKKKKRQLRGIVDKPKEKRRNDVNFIITGDKKKQNRVYKYKANLICTYSYR